MSYLFYIICLQSLHSFTCDGSAIFLFTNFIWIFKNKRMKSKRRKVWILTIFTHFFTDQSFDIKQNYNISKFYYCNLVILKKTMLLREKKTRPYYTSACLTIEFHKKHKISIEAFINRNKTPRLSEPGGPCCPTPNIVTIYTSDIFSFKV